MSEKQEPARAAYEAYGEGEYGFGPFADLPEDVKQRWQKVANTVSALAPSQSGSVYQIAAILLGSVNAPEGEIYRVASEIAALPAPSEPVSSEPITQKEMIELFGSEMPIEAVNLLYDCPDDWTIADVRRKLREIAASLPSPSGAKAVAVKPLEWENLSNGNLKSRLSAFDYRYFIYPRNGLFLLHHASSLSDDSFETEEAAKAAAQADYERRILSALAHPLPAEVGRVLEPFVDFVSGASDWWDDERRISTLNMDFDKFRLGMFRAARDLLSKTWRTGE